MVRCEELVDSLAMGFGTVVRRTNLLRVFGISYCVLNMAPAVVLNDNILTLCILHNTGHHHQHSDMSHLSACHSVAHVLLPPVLTQATTNICGRLRRRNHHPSSVTGVPAGLGPD